MNRKFSSRNLPNIRIKFKCLQNHSFSYPVKDFPKLQGFCSNYTGPSLYWTIKDLRNWFGVTLISRKSTWRWAEIQSERNLGKLRSRQNPLEVLVKNIACQLRSDKREVKYLKKCRTKFQEKSRKNQKLKSQKTR